MLQLNVAERIRQCEKPKEEEKKHRVKNNFFHISSPFFNTLQLNLSEPTSKFPKLHLELKGNILNWGLTNPWTEWIFLGQNICFQFETHISHLDERSFWNFFSKLTSTRLSCSACDIVFVSLCLFCDQSLQHNKLINFLK